MPSLVTHNPTINQHSSFSDNVSGESFVHQQFTDFSGHNKIITKCDFSYAFFQRAYFRKVKFINCNFTGAKFFDSNLRDAEFENCIFSYSIFKFTLLRYTEILKNLPEWPNVRVLLLQNLRANASSFGDTKAIRAFILEEIDSSKEHLRGAIKKTDRYYATKYKGLMQNVLIRWQNLTLKIDGWVWGHGELPWKIIRSVFITLLTIALIQTLFTTGIFQSSVSNFLVIWFKSFKLDIKAFTGISNLGLNNSTILILILMRYITLGLFIRILFNRYTWR